MIIHHNGKKLPSSRVSVTCLDTLMAETLMCSPAATPGVITVEIIKSAHKSNPNIVLYNFLSGAMLVALNEVNEFEIIVHDGISPKGYHYLAAINELKMLDTIRLAKVHYVAMVKTRATYLLDTQILRIRYE